MTNVTYRLVITTDTRGPAFQGTSPWCISTTTWSSVPFLVNDPGVTVNSVEAGIVNNAATASAPAITPSLSVAEPVLASGSLAISFIDGEGASPGFYFFGDVPSNTGLPVTRWFALDLPPFPLLSVPFVADANGDHALTIPIMNPALVGASLGVQAVQVHSGPPPEPYGTNAWRVDIR
jgi:hypothetical protein